MSDPIVYSDRSARHQLPLLFAGQAQKEIFVNEAFLAIDALSHPVLSGEGQAPPTSPAAGETWFVMESALGEWGGHDGELAYWTGDRWLFSTPPKGMIAFDEAKDAYRFCGQTSSFASTPAEPTGGPVIDAEARATIVALMQELRKIGILSVE